MPQSSHLWRNPGVGRRAFLCQGALLMTARAGIRPFQALSQPVERELGSNLSPILRIGLVTDIHYADKEPRGTRFYRESLDKLRQGIDQFKQDKLDFIIELGDLVDSAETVDEEISYLRAIEAVFADFGTERHYVLGNHCVWTLTKEQFFEYCGRPSGYYSFDRGGIHFVVLDACFRSDAVPYGNRNFEWTDTDIPKVERDWLERDLKESDLPTLVFVHQRLDVEGHYGVRSQREVRDILEKSGQVLAVFQGHNHVNDVNRIGGIFYCTLDAVIEGSGMQNNAYGILEVFPGGDLKVTGFHRQAGYEWG